MICFLFDLFRNQKQTIKTLSFSFFFLNEIRMNEICTEPVDQENIFHDSFFILDLKHVDTFVLLITILFSFFVYIIKLYVKEGEVKLTITSMLY